MGHLNIGLHSEDELERTHQTALRVLAEVGVKVEHEGLCHTLKRAGAKVDDASGIVKLPNQMVNQAIKTAPSRFELHMMDGKALQIGDESKHFGSVFTDPVVVDYDQGPREPVVEDLVRNARLADSLSGISFLMVTVQKLQDVPQHLSALETFAALMTSTTKHLVVCLSKKELVLLLEMAEIASHGGGVTRDPFISVGIPVTSPLRLVHEDGEILELALSKGLPIVAENMPASGSTAPFTLAGLDALSTAEALFILTAAQILRPGVPVILENGGSIMNMKAGKWVQYSLERALFNWFVGEMGRYYDLPTWGVGGGSQVADFDIQNGIESMLMVFAGMVSSVNMVCGIGSCCGGLGVSPEQILLDHDILEVCSRLKEGIEVDDEHLGLDSIRRVGPGGNFLDDELTLRLLKSGEHFYGGGFNLSDGHGPEDSMYARSHRRVEELLSTHSPQVPQKVVEEIGRFVREKENELFM